MYQPAEPLIEKMRFFSFPPDRQCAVVDAQTIALDRVFQRCNELRPHLRTPETFGQFIAEQPNPLRVHRLISLALAINSPDHELLYGVLCPGQLEAFRQLSQRKLAAALWVFS